jgi:hypothetical protein
MWRGPEAGVGKELNILRRMKERYDNPSPEEVTAAFSEGILDDALAERFARALALLWDDLPDESAHLAAPRIERAVRDTRHSSEYRSSTSLAAMKPAECGRSECCWMLSGDSFRPRAGALT